MKWKRLEEEAQRKEEKEEVQRKEKEEETQRKEKEHQRDLAYRFKINYIAAVE